MTTRDQRATAGEYDLDVFYGDGQWHWKVVTIRNNQLPTHTGDAKTLDGAKRSAIASIGLVQASWTGIGPLFDIPD